MTSAVMSVSSLSRHGTRSTLNSVRHSTARVRLRQYLKNDNYEKNIFQLEKSINQISYSFCRTYWTRCPIHLSVLLLRYLPAVARYQVSHWGILSTFRYLFLDAYTLPHHRTLSRISPSTPFLRRLSTKCWGMVITQLRSLNCWSSWISSNYPPAAHTKLALKCSNMIFFLANF